MFWLYLIFCLGFDLLGLSLGKKYVLTDNWIFLVASIISFIFVSLFFVQMMRYEGMGIANTIWAVVSLLGSIAIGLLIFHEKISSFQFWGIFFCLIGIILIQWSTK